MPDGDDAKSWIDGGELHMLIRLCLLARDGRRDGGHSIEAENLFGALVAEYARRGEYVAVSRGRLIYHTPRPGRWTCSHDRQRLREADLRHHL